MFLSDTECRLCGARTPLTEEHAPPKAAANAGPAVLHHFVENNGSLTLRSDPFPDGLSFKVFCSRCNSKILGSRYGTEYLTFVRQVAEAAAGVEPRATLRLNTRLFPLRIVKYALGLLCATTPRADLLDVPNLRDFIRHRDSTGVPNGIRLYLFVPFPPGTLRSTGRTAVRLGASSPFLHLAESSFWPIGWLYSFGSEQPPPDWATDVTRWGDESFGQRCSVSIELPVQWTVGPGAGEFRTAEELAARPPILISKRSAAGLPPNGT